MPTAQDILASDRPVVIVLDVVVDNTTVIDPTYNDWIGGKSMLALPMDVDSIDNDSQLYLSTAPVSGLASNVVVFGEAFIDRSIDAPFEGGLNVDYGKLSIACDPSVNDLKLFQRDFYNRSFTMWIGYEGDAWASFQTLYTGKTLGRTIVGDELQLDLSINAVGTEKPFPVERFVDGRVKPYLFGTHRRFKPVKVNPGEDDGLWQFTSGAVGTTDDEFNYTPMGYCNPRDSIIVGKITYHILKDGQTEVTESSAIPEDITQGDGSIVSIDGVIQMTIPSSGTDPAIGGGTDPHQCYVDVQPEDINDISFIDHEISVLMYLDSASTVDEYTLQVINGSNSDDITITKTESSTYKEFYSSAGRGALAGRVRVSATPIVADDAETIVINIVQMKVNAGRIRNQDVRAYGSDLIQIPTFRVDDATTAPSLPDLIAVYDDAGYLKISDNVSDFSMRAVGDTTNDDLVSACQYISTQANATASPITSSITSPTIGWYVSEGARMIDLIRSATDQLDMYLDVSETSGTIDIKRRWNGLPVGQDGGANTVNSFSFTDDDIVSFTEQASEKAFKTYDVTLNARLTHPEHSPTKTATNIFSRSNESRRIETILTTSNATQAVADLVIRDGAQRRFFEIELYGAGKGLKPEMVGNLSHRKTKPGLLAIRSVREHILTKRTIITGVKNG